MYLLAQGKRLEEISLIMAVKPTTIATFIKRIKSKLECDTLAQAVYEGLMQEQIPPLSEGIIMLDTFYPVMNKLITI